MTALNPSFAPSITQEDIFRLCATIADFSHKADLRWRAMPVVAWEFATLGEYACALVAVRQAIPVHEQCQRVVAPHIYELDAYGVTFRLICKAKVASARGPYAATEIKYEGF